MAGSTIGQRNALSAAALVVAAVLFVGVIVLSSTLLRSAQVDLTEEKLFTLSEGSERIAQSIDEPITLRFYFSDTLAREIPAIGIYAQRVRDLLEEFVRASDGKIRLEIYDPEPFSPAEDRAVAFGLQGVPVDQSGELVYFGLAGTNSTDDTETIAFFDQSRERFLEYDIARVVHNLANPEKRKVGLITSLPLSGSPYRGQPGAPDDSWIAYSQLEEFFEIEPIRASSGEIPEDIDVLLLVHPKDLTDETLFAIDQFVLRGGRLIAFIDPHSEADAARANPAQPGADTGSNLEKLLAAWGVEMPADKIAGDLRAARRVQVPSESESRVAAIDYPLWMALTGNNFDRNDQITSTLNQLNLASPGFLRKTEGSAIEMTPLLFTSAEGGGTVDASRVKGRAADPVAVVRGFETTGEPLTLAARLHGQVKTAFPEGPPQPEDEEEDSEESADSASENASASEEGSESQHLLESENPIDVVVVADVDLLADAMWVRVQDFFGQRIAVPMAQNGSFFVNAVDNLSGSSELIGLRGRGVAQRPFTTIQEIQREAERGFRAKEQELLAKLQETENRLKDLQKQEEGQGTTVLTPEQKEAIESFRDEAVRIRQELREVQHALRRDVENLTSWIKAANIGLIPVLVAIVAVVLAAVRRSQRKRPRLS